MTLLICRTCPRYDTRRSGEFGDAISAAVAGHPEVRTLGVACLGGCPRGGVVALDGPGRTRVRFTGLGEADVDAILEAAAAYEMSGTGSPGEWSIPETLRSHLSSVTVKRGPGAGGNRMSSVQLALVQPEGEKTQRGRAEVDRCAGS